MISAANGVVRPEPLTAGQQLRSAFPPR
jgi:hypothetical protein